jgi:hypothetical protein
MYTKSKVAFMTLITALAALAIVLTIHQQDVVAFNDNNNQFVFNDHSHTQCGAGTCPGNDGSVSNSPILHSNENFNSHREDTTKSNCFVKPGNLPCP